MGTLLYYLLWPLVWFYAPLQTRVRVIVIVDDQLLVVRNWFGPNTYQLPGGGIKFHEKPLIAAKRELYEELHIEAENIELLTGSVVAIRQHGLLMRYHYAVVKLPHKPSISMSKELVATKWVSSSSSVLPQSIRKILKQG